MPKPTELEKLFGLQLLAYKMQGWEREYYFHPERKWRFDYAHEGYRIAVELQGGIFGKKSGHNSGVGIRNGMEKLNEAQRLGWKVYQFYVDDVKSGSAILYLQKCLQTEKAGL